MKVRQYVSAFSKERQWWRVAVYLDRDPGRWMNDKDLLDFADDHRKMSGVVNNLSVESIDTAMTGGDWAGAFGGISERRTMVCYVKTTKETEKLVGTYNKKEAALERKEKRRKEKEAKENRFYEVDRYGTRWHRFNIDDKETYPPYSDKTLLLDVDIGDDLGSFCVEGTFKKKVLFEGDNTGVCNRWVKGWKKK